MAKPLSPMMGLMTRAHAPVYRARLRALTAEILRHLHPDDRVLDVGCGSGELGRALLEHPHAPAGLRVEGLERVPRSDCAIPVASYDGGRMPYDDGAFDVVIVADVLHHDDDPDALLRECARVASRAVVVKDHQRCGPLARGRIALIDWAANAPHGVPCKFRYNTPSQWRDAASRAGLRPIVELSSMNLYPPLLNLLFGRSLHYFAVLERSA